MTLNKSDIIKGVNKAAGFKNLYEARELVELALAFWSYELMKGRTVSLKGIGTLRWKRYKSRKCNRKDKIVLTPSRTFKPDV